jgi:shikimate kinase
VNLYASGVQQPESSVVLLGPPATGKSTVGPLIAALLERDFVDLDEIGDEYYSEVGQPLRLLRARIDEDGFAAAHFWWQPARSRRRS